MYPAASIIVESDPFKSVIESEDHDETREEDFSQALAGLSAFCQKWADARVAELLEKMRSVEGREGLSPKDRLSLATSYFIFGTSPLWYARERVLFATEGWDVLPTYAERAAACSLSGFAAPQSLETVKRLIELSGLDPETATIAEMDEKDARFRCQCATTGLSPRRCDANLIRSWRNCVSPQDCTTFCHR